ncbi:hypothetical protein CAQ69_22995 [Stutzerimonas stutzeri]|nr:hypothetical protein CAQ69_22995 [Stutzerimonas stutzeri]
MLFAPALADRAILPTAWGSSHFFNRIGRNQPSPPSAMNARGPRRHRPARCAARQRDPAQPVDI